MAFNAYAELIGAKTENIKVVRVKNRIFFTVLPFKKVFVGLDINQN